MDIAPITLPTGVTLRAPEDTKTLRSLIYDNAKQRFASAFPATYNGVRMEVHDVDYADSDDFPIQRQKQALLGNEFLARRLRGTIRLFDDKTNQVLDEKTMTLMRVPHLTDRGTFIYNGSEYAHVTQGRRRHGAYTRRQNNGVLETEFNVRPGSGSSFRVNFEPADAQYRMRIGGSNLHLYSLLKDIGVPDEEVETMWGPEITERNRAKYDARVLDKAYSHLVNRREQLPDATPSLKAEAIRKALDSTLVSHTVAKRTLPGMLGQKAAAAWRAEIGIKSAATRNLEFAPDLSATEAYTQALEVFDSDGFVKVAATAGVEFSPDLKPDDMQEAYNAIYAKVGPQLAGMKAWPKEWFTDESDPLGWVSWYINYAHGHRTNDDERQIQRWKNFKTRHGSQFKRNPTARRAFALRYWAIDPMKMVDDSKRGELQKEMDDYRAKRVKDFDTKREEIKTASAPYDVPDPQPFTERSRLHGDEWFSGFLKYAKAKNPSTFKGCLMVYFSLPDSKGVLEWVEENIPEDQVAGDGYEREVHATLLFGVGPDVTTDELKKIVKDYIEEIGAIYIAFKRVSRFPAHAGRNTDVILVKLDSPAMSDLHYTLREKLGDRCKVTWPDYKPHCTLAYVKPGALKKLDGHAKFDGSLFPVRRVIYSLPDRSDKIVIYDADAERNQQADEGDAEAKPTGIPQAEILAAGKEAGEGLAAD